MPYVCKQVLTMLCLLFSTLLSCGLINCIWGLFVCLFEGFLLLFSCTYQIVLEINLGTSRFWLALTSGSLVSVGPLPFLFFNEGNFPFSGICIPGWLVCFQAEQSSTLQKRGLKKFHIIAWILSSGKNTRLSSHSCAAQHKPGALVAIQQQWSHTCRMCAWAIRCHSVPSPVTLPQTPAWLCFSSHVPYFCCVLLNPSTLSCCKSQSTWCVLIPSPGTQSPFYIYLFDGF